MSPLLDDPRPFPRYEYCRNCEREVLVLSPADLPLCSWCWLQVDGVVWDYLGERNAAELLRGGATLAELREKARAISAGITKVSDFPTDRGV